MCILFIYSMLGYVCFIEKYEDFFWKESGGQVPPLLSGSAPMRIIIYLFFLVKMRIIITFIRNISSKNFVFFLRWLKKVIWKMFWSVFFFFFFLEKVFWSVLMSYPHLVLLFSNVDCDVHEMITIHNVLGSQNI